MKFSPITLLLATNVFLSGVAFAATAPYRAIVGVDTLGLSNATFGLVMALSAIGGAVSAVALGWLSDKVSDRRWIVLLCAIVGGVGFAAIWAIQTPVVYIAAFCLLLPFGNALFSQSFSYSRAYFDRQDPTRADFRVSLLRTVFTVAWVVIPPVAGWIAARTDAFAVFLVAAAAHLGSTMLIGLLWTRPDARIGSAGNAAEPLPAAHIRRSHRIGILGVTFAKIALVINTTVLPLVILRDLGGTLADVGINAAIAAAVEVPCMIAWSYALARYPKERIIAVTSVVMGIYLGLTSIAQSVLQVMLLQVVAAIAIAALMSITISYLQEAIKGRIGLSTSLNDATQVVAVMAASAVFALNFAQLYAPLMAVGAFISVIGGGLMFAAERIRAQEAAVQAESA